MKDIVQTKCPLIRYHGGKWMLAPWIIQNLPPHRVYVEPFGGGGSVLLRKPRSYAEVYNDLDSEIVSLFRVVREHGARLVELLRLTPFSREEYLEAWYPADEPIEQARRTIIRAFMGFGSSSTTLSRLPANAGRGGLAATGFRANSNKSGTTPGHDWANYPEALELTIQRLQGVIIENKNALTLMPQHDGHETVFYVDPPYVSSTRDRGADYRHEMADSDHRDLADVLRGLTGMVVLSGYASQLYDELYSGWHRVERFALADGARTRTECLWLNDAAMNTGMQGRLIA